MEGEINVRQHRTIMAFGADDTGASLGGVAAQLRSPHLSRPRIDLRISERGLSAKATHNAVVPASVASLPTAQIRRSAATSQGGSARRRSPSVTATVST
jgi:hypothetical protein